MTRQGPQALARGRIPDEELAVRAARCQKLTIPRKVDAVNAAGVTSQEGVDQLARLEIPAADGLVPGTTYEDILTNCQAGNSGRVTSHRASWVRSLHVTPFVHLAETSVLAVMTSQGAPRD